jgi:hypothetical protein
MGVGLATAHSQRVIVGGGGRKIGVARVRFTEAGRRALARCCNELVVRLHQGRRHENRYGTRYGTLLNSIGTPA